MKVCVNLASVVSPRVSTSRLPILRSVISSYTNISPLSGTLSDSVQAAQRTKELKQLMFVTHALAVSGLFRPSRLPRMHLGLHAGSRQPISRISLQNWPRDLTTATKLTITKPTSKPISSTLCFRVGNLHEKTHQCDALELNLCALFPTGQNLPPLRCLTSPARIL